jgi:hypothetical protein
VRCRTLHCSLFHISCLTHSFSSYPPDVDSVLSGVAASTRVAYQVDGTAMNPVFSNEFLMPSKITDKDLISTEAVEAAPQSFYSYTEEFVTSLPAENACNTQTLMNPSFTFHRKAAKRTFPWELAVEELNLATPPQDDDI